MVRYAWISRDGKYLYFSTDDFTSANRIEVPTDPRNTIYVNILDHSKYKGMEIIKVKLFYADGFILEGWTATDIFPIRLTNEEELYDGRFNQ